MLTGLEDTALTNSIMAQSSLFFVISLWLAGWIFPGLHPMIAHAARWFSVAPLAWCAHRWFWSNGIFAGTESDAAWGFCDRESTPDVVETACRYGGWFLDHSDELLWPVMLGALCTMVGVRIINARRVWWMVGLFIALQVPPAIVSVWLA